jgi:hypothetical protein
MSHSAEGTRDGIRRSITVLILIAFVTATSNGCVSIDLSRSPAAGSPESGSVDVRVYDRPSDLDGKKLTSRRIATELVRLENGKEIPVTQSTDASWRLEGLEAGHYKLRVTGEIDEAGQLKKLANREAESFHLKPGQNVRVDVVVKKFPFGPVFGPVVGVGLAIGIGAIVLASIWHSLSLSNTQAPTDEPKAHVPTPLQEKHP